MARVSPPGAPPTSLGAEWNPKALGSRRPTSQEPRSSAASLGRQAWRTREPTQQPKEEQGRLRRTQQSRGPSLWRSGVLVAYRDQGPKPCASATLRPHRRGKARGGRSEHYTCPAQLSGTLSPIPIVVIGAVARGWQTTSSTSSRELIR